MIVDAHHHQWASGFGYPFLEAGQFASLRGRRSLDDLHSAASGCGVTTAVVVQAVPEVAETQRLLQIANQSGGFVAGVVGWLDLHAHNLPQAVERLRSSEGGSMLVGIRYRPPAEGRESSRTLSAMHAVANAGLAIDVLLKPHQIPLTIATLEHVPQARFVLDHAGNPDIAADDLNSWRPLLQAMAALPHVSCKLSGLITRASRTDRRTREVVLQYYDEVLSAFGPHRTMFGSDWPMCLLASSYRATVSLVKEAIGHLSVPERRRVLAETAIDAYRLK